jgi:electron transfer flavoprotein-quinone oxidoreductase
MFATGSQSVSVDVRSDAWAKPPFNGATTFRSDFDPWLASKAEGAGAVLVTSTTATGLLRDRQNRIVGVETDRPDGAVGAHLVVACDGVNSFLAREAGLYEHFSSEHFTLGAKEVLHLGKEEIDRRFALVERQGVDIEIVGLTRGVPGGAFLYTNLDSVSVGVVVSVEALSRSGIRPEELIAGVKRHPSIAPYLQGAELVEYSAHVIPEGGYDTMPSLVADGLLVAGDAGAFCLAAGLFLEGVNFAIGSGRAAGETAVAAASSGDWSAAGLSTYEERLGRTFVMADHKKMRRAPALMLSNRMQLGYPALVCDLAEGLFTVANPSPKAGLLRLFERTRRRHRVRLADIARDTYGMARTFG